MDGGVWWAIVRGHKELITKSGKKGGVDLEFGVNRYTLLYVNRGFPVAQW